MTPCEAGKKKADDVPFSAASATICQMCAR
jgi:hypothetical protein